jgi:hypothetical protein
MTIRFPKRRVDGSFDLFVKLRGVPGPSHLRTWLAAWAERNGTWERCWESGGTVDREVLCFADEFSAPPTFEARDDGTAGIRFRVRPTSKLWKDWTSKVYDDLRKEYGDGVELAGMDSITE